jgi:hypothetical protein
VITNGVTISERLWFPITRIRDTSDNFGGGGKKDCWGPGREVQGYKEAFEQSGGAASDPRSNNSGNPVKGGKKQIGPFVEKMNKLDRYREEDGEMVTTSTDQVMLHC